MPRVNAPAAAVTGPVLRLTVMTTTAGQKCETIHDYEATLPAATTPAQMLAFIVAWQATNEANYLACLTPDTTLDGYSVAVIDTNTIPTLFQGVTPGTVGSVAGHALPLEMACVIHRVTGLKGQHGIGRWSMPAIPISFSTPATDPNKINAAGITAYGTLAASVTASVVAAGRTWEAVVTTRPIKPATLVIRAQPVTSYLVVPLMGTIRRRKEGRGQ